MALYPYAEEEEFMNYHISNALIIDHFKRPGECPLCGIYREVESLTVEQFQGESVMLDDARERVNRKGFCAKHALLVSKGENKLGAALQMHTRLGAVEKSMKKVTNAKNALLAGEEVLKQLDTCAVCDSIDENMRRYYEAIPKLYGCEDGFDGLFRRSKGFCMRHYAELLQCAKRAGSRADEFAALLYRMQTENLERIRGELDRFCNQFDYRAAGLELGSAADALPRAISKMHGE